MSTSTVAVTTVANAAAMTNATASSTRLPRRMKFLNPVMTCLPRGRPGDGPGCSDPATLAGNHHTEEVGGRGARDAVDVGRSRRDHDQTTRQRGAAGRLARLGWRDRE